MNLTNVFEQLSRLYEAEGMEETGEQIPDEEEISEKEDNTEGVDEEETLEDEVEETSESAEQKVIECQNCGGLTITSEVDLTLDAGDTETEVPTTAECDYCGETTDYVIIGSFIPSEEVDEESEDDLSFEEAFPEEEEAPEEPMNAEE